MVVLWRYFCWFLRSGGVLWGHGWVTHPRGLRVRWVDSEKIGFVGIKGIYDLILITYKEAQENGCFMEVFLLVFAFWWGPMGSWVGDPPPGVENGVG